MLIIALAGGTLRVRGQGMNARLSLRSIIRYLCRRGRRPPPDQDRRP